MKITPLVKGIITGSLMIVAILGIYYSKNNADGVLQYLVYILYALGITWTILIYRRSPSFTGKFGGLFGQGFRCFIIVTLIMAIFYAAFNYQHPEFSVESANAQKEELLKKNDKTPAEIETEISAYKKQYTLILVSGAIFGYLIIGAGITAAVSALVTRRK